MRRSPLLNVTVHCPHFGKPVQAQRNVAIDRLVACSDADACRDPRRRGARQRARAALSARLSGLPVAGEMNARAAAVVLVAIVGAGGAGCEAPRARVLPSQVPARVAGATALGPVGADEPIAFVLAMALDERARAVVADGAAPLSPEAFAAAFAPSRADYARLLATLAAGGLEVEASPSRTTVTVRGRAADVERALGTPLSRYADGNGLFRAPGELRLRPGIEELVAGAAGLDDAGGWTSQRAATGTAVGPTATPVPHGASGSLEPADLRARYDLPANLGDGETIAILGTGTAPSLDDVAGYAAKFALPVDAAAQYAQVLVGGPNRDLPGRAESEYGENLLDVDLALAVAPHARIVHVLTATNAPGLFSDGIVYIVNQLAAAHQVSVSFGTCERVAAGEVLVLEQLFLQARAEGQQWFFSSGDNGTDGCGDGAGNLVLSVNWPASSPYVIAVGGTALDGATEVAWAGGGGGTSELLDKPAWQSAQAGDARARTPGDGVRDLPDVAAIAGAPGVAIYGRGMLFAGVEGTSVGTPLWAALWALLDEARGGGRGFVDGSERLYRLGATSGAGLADVTGGGNGDGTTPGYAATAGWDFASGWGTPDGAALVAAW